MREITKTARKVLGILWRRRDVTLTVVVMIGISFWAPRMTKSELIGVGGGLYLCNKVLLDLMERRRKLTDDGPFWFYKRWGWAVYLMGLPAVVAMFLKENNLIFAAIEIGGAPSMMYGLVGAVRRRKPPAWMDMLAILAVLVGLILSLWHFLEQVGASGVANPLAELLIDRGLEAVGGITFLVATILLAKDDDSGYNWFLPMNMATGILMYRQGYQWFALLQLLSIFVVLDSRRANKEFMRIPQIENLDQLARAIRFPYPTYTNGFPFSLRLWNRYLVTVDHHTRPAEPADFEEPGGWVLDKDFHPAARRLAEEGGVVIIGLQSHHPHDRACSFWRWERHPVK